MMQTQRAGQAEEVIGVASQPTVNHQWMDSKCLYWNEVELDLVQWKFQALGSTRYKTFILLLRYLEFLNCFSKLSCLAVRYKQQLS
ncbi:hypothetical protein L3X38_035772 [Prunus dulcis]|uniref:Uncharacterized protein n=1 Tax=Prunus dulcis TaxID=3755 RepID=A0AAD4VLM5_PRUDU|nr:hypothetical protein L3X38_035772 [Prunus dulcis]